MINVDIDQYQITAFCQKWKVKDLSLFGSVLRDDFVPDSDVDVLVVFEPEAPWTYFDWADMTDELKAIFHREIDLVELDGLRNTYRRHSIMKLRKVFYAA